MLVNKMKYPDFPKYNLKVKTDKKIRFWIIIFVMGNIYLNLTSLVERFAVKHYTITGLYILINLFICIKWDYIFKKIIH